MVVTVNLEASAQQASPPEEHNLSVHDFQLSECLGTTRGTYANSVCVWARLMVLIMIPMDPLPIVSGKIQKNYYLFCKKVRKIYEDQCLKQCRIRPFLKNLI